jgi:pimeloyl-ACP methyl ester carboxylesterase
VNEGVPLFLFLTWSVKVEQKMPSLIQEKEIMIQERKVFYKVGGKGDPILILHGWAGSSASWQKVQENLIDQGFLVLVPDLPGFGKSEVPKTPWSVKDYAAWVKEFVEKLNLDIGNNKSLIIVGHSFGGRIIAKLSAQNLLPLKAVVLIDAAGLKKEKSRLFFFFKNLGNLFLKIPFLNVFAPFLKKIFYRFFVGQTDYLKLEGVMKETFKKVVAEDLSRFFESIKIPCLILWGKEDKITPLSDAYWLHKKIKGSFLEIIERAGHNPHKIFPELISQKITNFIFSLKN